LLTAIFDAFTFDKTIPLKGSNNSTYRRFVVSEFVAQSPDRNDLMCHFRSSCNRTKYTYFLCAECATLTVNNKATEVKYAVGDLSKGIGDFSCHFLQSCIDVLTSKRSRMLDDGNLRNHAWVLGRDLGQRHAIRPKPEAQRGADVPVRPS
jgi:hypothetical protein